QTAITSRAPTAPIVLLLLLRLDLLDRILYLLRVGRVREREVPGVIDRRATAGASGGATTCACQQAAQTCGDAAGDGAACRRAATSACDASARRPSRERAPHACMMCWAARVAAGNPLSIE